MDHCPAIRQDLCSHFLSCPSLLTVPVNYVIVASSLLPSSTQIEQLQVALRSTSWVSSTIYRCFLAVTVDTSDSSRFAVLQHAQASRDLRQVVSIQLQRDISRRASGEAVLQL
eukprot:767885-Hanusia_phi.AAC.11